VDDNFDPRQLIVKFKDGLHFHALEGRLTNTVPEEIAPVQPLLDSLSKAHWRRVDKISEEEMEAIRQTAQLKLGRALPDLNQEFRVFLPADTNAAPVIDALNALDIVELAQPIPRPAPLPVAPDFRPLQGYLNLSQDGIGAACTQTNCNLRGETVKVCDIEYSYTPTHLDLPTVTLLGGDIILGGQMDPFAEAHGTASLGEMASLNNGIGTLGIAPNSSYYFYGIWEYVMIDDIPTPVWDIPGAITAVIPSLGPGDILLLELQTSSSCGGYTPVEWDLPVYNRIVLAVGLGITVVEPGANGGLNLDAPCFSIGNGGHWPFLQGNGSGAILVGGGAAPPAFGGTDVPRSRLPFSDYGSAVHVQGWGERVTTTGFGGLYNGLNELYTGGFNGTSAASPIVAGACALLQSVFKANNGGNPLTPAQIRQVLINTGTPQQAGVYPVSQHIGPLPNVKAALTQIIPPKLYLNTDPKAGWIITWDGCGYLESSPLIGPIPTWAPVEVGVEHNTYTLDPAVMRGEEARFYRVSWH
jgi:hypothetical protein